MRLPEVELDDRRFQDLVNEARQRIARTCPEWTDHNVSDPGITLIELFAWMTDMLVYRVNRIPDKLHVALLELLGIELDAPAAAATDVRFMLAAPVIESVRIAAEVEVATTRTVGDDPVVFQLREDFEIPALRPAAYLVARGGEVRDIGVAGGTARPDGDDQLPFGAPPQIGDALYLGFEAAVGRLVLQLDVDASPARGAGVDPEDPPLAWEVAQRAGTWEPAEVLRDGTGGFNYGSGAVTLQLPPTSASVLVGGRALHWLRCRLTETTRVGLVARYTQPPSIAAITAAPIGALLATEHATRVPAESLGFSDGTPGQAFPLRFAPVLELRSTESLEVRAAGEPDAERWERRDSFADSGPDDRHFVLDEAAGELQLGPAIREADGTWRQHGAVPPKGEQLWMTGYRHGGGQAGNVAADTLRVLRSPIPGVAIVSNPRPAVGGVDVESLDSARRRAALEIRSRSRAVTAGDFEFLAGEASPHVARATCVAGPDHRLAVHVLPLVMRPARPLTPAELVPGEELLATVSAYLDERRLVGTSLHVCPVQLRGTSVHARLRARPGADEARIEREAADALYRYLNPLCGGTRAGHGEGWPFGRALNPGELHGVLHDVAGVDLVTELDVYAADLHSGERAQAPVGGRLDLAPHEVIASVRHVIVVEEG